MSFIRARQQGITRVLGHQGNRRYAVPNRPPGGYAPPPPPPPPPPPADPPPWDAFRTHADMDNFAQHWVDDHGLELPPEWPGWTLPEKAAWLNVNVGDPSP